MEKKAVYQCKKCKNLIESLWRCEQEVSCCGAIMEKLVPNTTEAAVEKYIPVIEREGDKVVVKVGSVAHPMTPEHYILFVEIVAGNTLLRHDFVEGDTVAEATFYWEGEIDEVRAYCNLHGFWSNKEV